ncbi:MAG: enoyl-CoA hydratase [Acetobacteraceae bacterium]|nr:enoyl-CoA hydratase [Acetobacteraceae bacterium]
MSASAAIVPNDPLVLRRDEGAVAVLTLNRPASRNALSRAMLAALSAELATIAPEQGLRCVVLTHEGPAFSGGHDLREMNSHRADADGGEAFFAETFGACAELMQAVVNLPQPVIAAVEGIATAAGCQLAASCDLVVASEAAKFGTSGIHAGLFCTTPGVALVRSMGRKPAMELLLTGDMVPAAEAQRMGLVNRVVAPGTALAAALELAGRIARHSGVALRLGKQGVNAQIGQPLDQAYTVASRIMVENLMAADAVEGMEAFLAKRAPVWTHR